MLPKRIKVKNFRGIAEMELNLSAISLAGISAPNGRGKSSFFTHSIVFALYGKPAPGCSLDDMVMKGQQDMLVAVDFEHNGEVYQVTRTRSLKGKGKSTCEFQKQTATGWEPLTGATIKETDEKIEQLLNLDASTFLASSLIMQGDASNFTKKLPGERKAILTQILGLEVYDKLQSAAKEREKSLTIELETSKNKMLDLEEKLQSLPEVERQIEDVKKAISLNSIIIREKEVDLSDAQVIIKDLEAQEQEAKQIERQINTLTNEINSHITDKSELDRKIGNAEIILESEPLITAKLVELEDIKAKIPALQAKEENIALLKADAKKHDDEYQKLQSEKHQLNQKVEALEKELSARDELKQASEDYQQGLTDLKAMDELADKWQDFLNQVMVIEKDTDRLGELVYEQKTLLNTCQNKLQAQKDKLAILANSGCPNPDNATCKFLIDANEAKKKIPDIANEIAEIEDKIYGIEEERRPLMEQIMELDKQQQALNYNSLDRQSLKVKIEALRKQAEAYTALSGKDELLQNLQQQITAISERIENAVAEINKTRYTISELQSETKDLPELQTKLTDLEKYVTMKDRLPEAKLIIQQSKEAIAKLEADIEAKNILKGELRDKYLSLHDGYSVALADNQEQLTGIQNALKALQSSLNSLYAEEGSCQAKLDALLKDAEEKEKLSVELAPKAKELVRWQTLVKAFGKNGIQALILENAIPELERISNDILSQMSNGAHSLRFETQRDLKSKDGVAETLDIIVSDWAGSRPYETYSGGEQLRIDLAIRFALAELLANRAGSKVEWIVADEIFGSQDTEHRELVIEAIKSVADRFKMILVISHITEAQAAFDQQIILGEGGKVEIVYS